MYSSGHSGNQIWKVQRCPKRRKAWKTPEHIFGTIRTWWTLSFGQYFFGSAETLDENTKPWERSDTCFCQQGRVVPLTPPLPVSFASCTMAVLCDHFGPCCCFRSRSVVWQSWSWISCFLYIYRGFFFWILHLVLNPAIYRAGFCQFRSACYILRERRTSFISSIAMAWWSHCNGSGSHHSAIIYLYLYIRYIASNTFSIGFVSPWLGGCFQIGGLLRVKLGFVSA